MVGWGDGFVENYFGLDVSFLESGSTSREGGNLMTLMILTPY